MTVTMLLLQVQGPLAEAAARTAAQAWHSRDVVTSLGATQLIRMLKSPGNHTNRAVGVGSRTVLCS